MSRMSACGALPVQSSGVAVSIPDTDFAHSGKAVEVQGASTVDGGNVVQYSDWNGTNQQWQLAKVG